MSEHDGHLVLKRKDSGKIASRKDQKKIALTLKAQQLTDDGQGGGIVSLLLPNSPQEKNKISEMANIYDVASVKPRSGKKTGKVDRLELSAAVNNDELICKLAVQFGTFVEKNPSPHAISAKAFSRWLKGELAKKDSVVYRIVYKHAPILLELERGDRWWEDALALRKNAELRTYNHNN